MTRMPSSQSNAGGSYTSQTVVDGHLVAYVHAPAFELLPELSDVSGQQFILISSGGGGQGTRKPAASGNRGGQGEQRSQGGAGQQQALDFFEPLVLDRQQGDHEMYVLLYRKIRNDEQVVAEVLSRLVVSTGGGKKDSDGRIVMFFEAVDKTELSEEAVVKVEERSKRVKNDFKVVQGLEIGCLVLVSFLPGVLTKVVWLGRNERSSGLLTMYL